MKLTQALLSFTLLTGAALAQNPLVTTLQSDPELSTLLEFVSLVPGLADQLVNATNVTILAPTNSAFEALLTGPDVPEKTAAQTRNVTSVGALLSNHVVKGAYAAANITQTPVFVQTLLDPSLVNDIQPFTNTTGGQFIGLILNGQDVDVLSGEFTVSRVTQADIRLGESVIIHKINRTLAFGPPVQTVALRAGLINVASAIVAAGLAGDNTTGTGEAGTSPLNYADNTIFVPNNGAFEDIGNLLGSLNETTLAQILSYHVVPGRVVFSPSLSNASVPTFLEGSEVQTTVFPDGSAFVNGAKIVLPNVILYNGVAHVIDGVLNPAQAGSFDRATINPAAPASDRVAFANATRETSLPLPALSTTEAPYTSTAAIFTTASAVPSPASESTSTNSAVTSYSDVAGILTATFILAGVGAVMVLTF